MMAVCMEDGVDPHDLMSSPDPNLIQAFDQGERHPAPHPQPRFPAHPRQHHHNQWHSARTLILSSAAP